jgi:hypothetical protein
MEPLSQPCPVRTIALPHLEIITGLHPHFSEEIQFLLSGGRTNREMEEIVPVSEQLSRKLGLQVAQMEVLQIAVIAQLAVSEIKQILTFVHFVQQELIVMLVHPIVFHVNQESFRKEVVHQHVLLVELEQQLVQTVQDVYLIVVQLLETVEDSIIFHH